MKATGTTDRHTSLGMVRGICQTRRTIRPMQKKLQLSTLFVVPLIINLQLFQNLRKNKKLSDYTETCLLLFYAFLSSLNGLSQSYFFYQPELGAAQLRSNLHLGGLHFKEVGDVGCLRQVSLHGSLCCLPRSSAWIMTSFAAIVFSPGKCQTLFLNF